MLVKILDKYPDVEFVQIQLNYLDWDSEKVCSGKLYEILSERNIPIVVMEPIKGGSLAQLRNDLEENSKPSIQISRSLPGPFAMSALCQVS